jgi:hypothetical protein
LTTPSEVAHLVARTATAGTVEEDDSLITFKALLDDEASRVSWRQLRAASVGFIRKVTIREVGSDAHLEDADAPLPGTVYQITISKAASPGILRLFFGRSLADNGNVLATVDVACIADMDPSHASFTTYRSRLQAWTIDAPPPFAASEPFPDPRRTSNDFTRRNVVPDDVRPWLLQTRPEKTSDAYEAWQSLAARKLLAATADQVSIKMANAPDDLEELVYHFAGPPSAKFEVSDETAVSLLSELTEGAVWTFATGARDADTRHLLLASEWARSYSAGRLGSGSVESAAAAYGAYVKSGSKESLKALADLRKTVVEEAQKASQRAQDMAGAMWKDLAVATTPFVIKVLPDAGKTANQWFAFWFAIGAAVFLVFSIGMQIFLNQRYFATQATFREIWKRRLNQVLSAHEVSEFSDTPIDDSMRDYRIVRNAITGLYAILVVILLAFACYQYAAATPPVGNPIGQGVGNQNQPPSNLQANPSMSTSNPNQPSPITPPNH